MSDNKETNRPSHAIYVIQGEGKKERWIKIGVAWPHKDNLGASLAFDALPAGNGRVALRLLSEKDAEESNTGGQR